MSDADAAVWARVLAGDPAGLAVLFDRHEPRVFGHASRLLTDRGDAKDTVAIAFLELWHKRSAVRLVAGSPLPWLLNAATHTALHLERSRRRYRALIDRFQQPDEVVELSGPDQSGVLVALKHLPAREQSVVALRVLEGYPERATALTLGIPEATVTSRLAHARAKLRDEFRMLEAS